MNFKLGDLVRFVDEPIEGHITSFQGNDIIGVTDDTGFEIPVQASKLTSVHGNMRREDDDLTQQSPSAPTVFIDKGIYLAVEGEPKDGLAKFLLINETSYTLLVSIAEVSGSKTTGIFAEKVMSNDSVQFFSANFANVGKWPTFAIQIIRHSKQQQLQTQPISKELRIKAYDISLAKRRNDVVDAKVWLFELDKPEENIGLDKLKSHFISHRPHK